MLAIIVNNKSGDGPEGPAREQALGDALAAQGVEATIHSTRKGEEIGSLADRLVREGARALVAAGGDGTIAAVAGTCHAAGVPLGIIPLGTFNYFARSHAIPQDVDGAVAILKAAQTREISLAAINDQLFLNNASIGLYPAILDLREDIYARYGRSRAMAYWSVIKALMALPLAQRLRLEVDGETRTVRTPLAFAAVSAYQLDEFGIEGADAVRKGKIALLLAKPEGRLALVRSAWRVARRKPRKDMDFDLITAENIVLRPPRRRPLVARDGEKSRMRAPLHVRRLDKPLTLFVPQGKGTAA